MPVTRKISNLLEKGSIDFVTAATQDTVKTSRKAGPRLFMHISETTCDKGSMFSTELYHMFEVYTSSASRKSLSKQNAGIQSYTCTSNRHLLTSSFTPAGSWKKKALAS
eukprot:4776653-Amphidinium_carterae.1